MSTSQIAKKLNTQPIRYNEKNSEWERGNVSYIFKDKAYLGNEDYPQIIEKEINDAEEELNDLDKPETYLLERNIPTRLACERLQEGRN